MSKHGIPRRGGFRLRREEKEVGSRPRDGKTNGLRVSSASNVKQGNRDEAIESYVRCPDECRRQMGEQPTEAKPFNEPKDMFWPDDWVKGSKDHDSASPLLDVWEQVEVLMVFIDPAFPFA